MTEPRLWWVGWREYDSPNDSRPLNFPPNEAIIAWWESGFAGDGSYATMVALVNAPTEEEAVSAVEKDWPAKVHVRHWRFFDEQIKRPLHVNTRFPFGELERKRLEALGVSYDVETR